MWTLKNMLGSIKANAIRTMPFTEDLLRYSRFRHYRYGKRCPFCGAGGSRPVLRFHLTTLRECPCCHLLYVHPRPRPDYLERYYSTQYKVAGSEWEEIRKLDLSRLPETIYGRTREISFVTEVKKGGTLLDLGCSWGFLMLQAREMGFTVKGVEVGRPYADYAREKLDLDVFPGQLEKAGFPTEYFDAIIGVHVLEHLPDLKTSFSEIRRILKDGGVAVFIVPNFESVTREVMGASWEWLDIRNHYYHLTRPFFERALKPLGFDLSFRSEEGHFGMNFLKERFSDAEIRDIHHMLKGSELIVTANKTDAAPSWRTTPLQSPSEE